MRGAGVAIAFGLALIVATAAEARYASIVIDYDTGRVLHETNADTRNYPASLVKMMTLYLTFEALERGRLRLEQRLKVSRRAAGMPPAKLGLKRGERITVKDAILALVTKSANDAAVVIAEALGKKETRFARIMNEKARELGMKRTSFRNASGLPNRHQLSTARDMATLARALIRNFPRRYDLFSTKEFTYKGRRYRNHNRLLRRYAGTDGIKTGYIRASGFNLVASVTRNGQRLIAAVFGGKTPRSRDRHITKLLDRGFAKLASIGADKIPGLPPRKPAFAVAADGREASDSALPGPAAAPIEDAAVEIGSAEEAVPVRAWGIQVGAYYRYKPAKRTAVAVAERLPDLLADTRITVTHIKGRRGRIYRSRLVGLTEAAARSACRRLARERIDCLVVRVGRRLALADPPDAASRT